MFLTDLAAMLLPTKEPLLVPNTVLTSLCFVILISNLRLTSDYFLRKSVLTSFTLSFAGRLASLVEMLRLRVLMESKFVVGFFAMRKEL